MGKVGSCLVMWPRCPKRFFDRDYRSIHRIMPQVRERCESATTHCDDHSEENMFEGPVTGNIPEVLDNGEVTDGTHVTAGQLAAL